MTLKEAIEAAGYTPRSYSGRAMYGRQCLGTTVPNVAQAIIDIGAQGVKFNAPRQDNMGLDYIIYWPDVPWTKDDEAHD